jgi:protein-histidine pros-kinase
VKLWLKFSAIFVGVFCIGLAVAGYICREFLLDDARVTVAERADLLIESMHATRIYTLEQVQPVIAQLIAKDKDKQFHPQTSPFYAATENFQLLRRKFPEYSYKQAALNPTNMRDRPVDWEADVIRTFRDDRGKKELIFERDTPTGRRMVLARPVVVDASCLPCHSTPSAAPASMVRLYGNVNGFGWKNGEVIGAQVISVPMEVPIHMADVAFRSLMTSLLGVGLVTLVVLNVGMYFMVVRPLSQLAKRADEISRGKLNNPEFPAKGNDEISMLARAFNRMQRSMAQAMKMLEEH